MALLLGLGVAGAHLTAAEAQTALPMLMPSFPRYEQPPNVMQPADYTSRYGADLRDLDRPRLDQAPPLTIR